MDDSFFRQLSPSEERVFRSWARDHYAPGSPVSEVWHPVVRDECAKINREQGLQL